MHSVRQASGPRTISLRKCHTVNRFTARWPSNLLPTELLRSKLPRQEALCMADNNKLKLVVEVDVNKANASIKSVNTGLSSMEQAAGKASEARLLGSTDGK